MRPRLPADARLGHQVVVVSYLPASNSGSGPSGRSQPVVGEVLGVLVIGKLPPRDDVDVDADLPGLPDDSPHDRAATHELWPPAALAGSDDDLSDVVFAGEVGDGGSRVVTRQLVPAGTEIAGQLVQRQDGFMVTGQLESPAT